MKKRRSWFLAVLILACVLGTAVSQYVDAWLAPRPEVFHLNQLLPAKQTNSSQLLFDRSQRWMYVVDSPGTFDARVGKAFPLFDLGQGGKRLPDIVWPTVPGRNVGYQQRQAGVRELYHQPDNELIVLDVSFADGSSKMHRFGKYQQGSILRTLIAEEGERIAVVYHLPMSPWRVLGNPNMPYSGLLDLQDRVCFIDIWDVAKGEQINHFSFPPPNWQNVHHNNSDPFIFSSDGQWLVRLETGNLPGSLYSPSLKVRFPFLPASPRGVQIINATNGDRRIILEQPYDKEELGAFTGMIRGNQLYLIHAKVHFGPGIQTMNEGSQREYATRSCTFYELATGKASSCPWPTGDGWASVHLLPDGLNEQGWLVYQQVEDVPWPRIIESIAEWLNYDLANNHLWGYRWRVMMFDPQSRELRFHDSVPISNYGSCMPNTSSSLIVQAYNATATNRLIYRWKVPFSEYSRWWSRIAGVIVALILLGSYGLLIKRRQQMMPTEKHAALTPTPHVASPLHSPAP